MEWRVRFLRQGSLILLTATLVACSSSVRIDRTYENPAYVDRSYNNILVLAVAADYNARSQFERSLARELRSSGTAATEYYEIADGDLEVTRDKILAAIERFSYDGVIVTQIGSRQSELSIETSTAETKVIRRDDRAVDFFRYDYEILNEPYQVNLKTEVVLVSDLFSASDARRVWTAESRVMDKSNIAYLIEDTAAIIARQLRSDGLVAD